MSADNASVDKSILRRDHLLLPVVGFCEVAICLPAVRLYREIGKLELNLKLTHHPKTHQN